MSEQFLNLIEKS